MRTVCCFLAVLIVIGCSRPTEPNAPVNGTFDIEVATSSANAEVDPDGYSVTVDGGPDQHVGVNVTVRAGPLPPGFHVIHLSGIASNCELSGPNPRWVEVIEGRRTPPVTFSVRCGPKIGSGAGDWDY